MLDEIFIDIFNVVSKLVDFTEHGVDIATAEDGSENASLSGHIFDFIAPHVREFFQVSRVQLVDRLALGLTEVQLGEPPLQHRTGDGVRSGAKSGLAVCPREREQAEKNGGDLVSHGRFLLEDVQSYETKGGEIVQSANIWHDVPLPSPTVPVPPPYGRRLRIFFGQGADLAWHRRGRILRVCGFRRLNI